VPVAAPSGRLRELDAIRGLAAITVMLSHFTTRYDEIYGHLPGVPFFIPQGAYLLLFIITGFAIALTLEKHPSVGQFVMARASRLFPAYWVAVLLTFEVVTRFGLPGREVSVKDALANLTMMQFYIGVPNVDGAYWSLALQINFYLAVCALILFRSRLTMFRFAGVWLVALFSLRGIHALGYSIPSRLETMAITDYGHLLIAGVTFYALRASPQSRIKGLALIAGCLLYAALFQTASELPVTFFFFGLMYLVATNRLRWLAARPLDAMGAISYSLYLLHQNVGFVIIREAYEHGVTSPAIAIAAAIAVSLSLATIITFGIEQPLVSFIRGVALRRASPALSDVRVVAQASNA
jgi:peptidoglycan/LPS O-acetylase OafA/YrhL